MNGTWEVSSYAKFPIKDLSISSKDDATTLIWKESNLKKVRKNDHFCYLINPGSSG